MKINTAIASSFVGLALSGFVAQAGAQSFSQGFNGTALPTGWVTSNLSTNNAMGTTWSVGPSIVDNGGNPVVGPHEGNGFAVVNYASISSGSGTISNWLISPEIFNIRNGDTFSFYTTTVPGSAFPDGLEFRLSTAGAGTSVGTTPTSFGSFSTTLATVNPSLAFGGYPEDWTLITATVSGLTGSFDGRVAFRYFVTDGGPTGDNSNVIGVDAFNYAAVAVTPVPEPATWALMVAGIVGVAGAQRRRAQQSNA